MQLWVADYVIIIRHLFILLFNIYPLTLIIFIYKDISLPIERETQVIIQNREAAAEYEEILEIFRSFDKDGNGCISKDEVKQCFIQLLNTESGKSLISIDKKLDEKADEFMKRHDVNEDGKIDIAEFWQYIQSV